jgi:hypothetical protein
MEYFYKREAHLISIWRARIITDASLDPEKLTRVGWRKNGTGAGSKW